MKRLVQQGRASIQCTYNNTIVTLADMNGAVLAWSSSGHLGFKGAKKSTPYAATQVVAEISEKVKKYGLQDLEVFVKESVKGARRQFARWPTMASTSLRSRTSPRFHIMAVVRVVRVASNLRQLLAGSL